MATSSIYDAISDENMTALRQWIKDGEAEDSDFCGWYCPLLHAVDVENLEACKALIAAGVNINFQYESVTESRLHIGEGGETRCTPLSLALYRDSVDIARLLIEAGASLDARIYVTEVNFFGSEELKLTKTCFEMVLESENEDLIDLFISKGADPNVWDTCGHTPLSKAIKARNIKRFTDLLELGADPTQVCEGAYDSGTPIALAIEEYCEYKDPVHLEMIKILIDRGGLTKLKYFNEHLLNWLFFEVKNPELDKLFDLDGIREHIKELEEEANAPSGLCPRTLLSPTDGRYREPRPCDIRELYSLALDKFSPPQLSRIMDVDEMIMEDWLHGKRKIPYPVWHLLIRIALVEGGVPTPL